ncbi:putative serine/threonine-protein kinase PIX7, partial [Cucurbita argyrosperma subsp. argyrosperma]
MGCFTVLKNKKKNCARSVQGKHVKSREIVPTMLPEPRSLQSAPPSFKIRVKPVQPANGAAGSRVHTLSAPSNLYAAEQDAYSSVEYDELDESTGRFGSKEQRSPSPQPLPLPSPQVSGTLKNTGSFKSVMSSGPLYASGPLPLPPVEVVRNFPLEEISAACHNFSAEYCVSESPSSFIYRATFGDDASTPKKFEAAVTYRNPSNQGYKEFVSEVNTLASLQHPNICKLLGFHTHEGSGQRMLVYERLFHGSLDRLLYGRSDGPPIDWNTRMKIALCAAQGLTFLHEEGPFQAMYNEFSTANIQIDKDFSAKLSGYELLTGRRNLDSRYPKEERNLVKWSKPFLTDDGRLSLIMDPQLKGRFPTKAARTVADIAQKCLQKDPSERPTMRHVVEQLKIIQNLKQSSRFPLQEPTAKQMLRSPSLDGIMITAPPPPPPPPPAAAAARLSFSPSPPSGVHPSLSPGGTTSIPTPPPQLCSTLSFEDFDRQERRKSSMSALRRPRIEGY